jgi:cytochrome c
MKYSPFLKLSLAAGLLALGACNRGSETRQVSRPAEAWVLRSVLDQKPRMLSIALHDKLWVAYNTQTGSLYKAWAGNVNFDGPVYTTCRRWMVIPGGSW